VTGVLQSQKFEFSFSLWINVSVVHDASGNKDSRHPRPFALANRSTLASSRPTTLSAARRVHAWPTKTARQLLSVEGKSGETYLVVCLDGAKLCFNALVSFLFLEEPQAGLVFHAGELGVFLLGFELFL
jgi:hypothetical protein